MIRKPDQGNQAHYGSCLLFLSKESDSLLLPFTLPVKSVYKLKLIIVVLGFLL
jgi:hypothetical protein